MAQNWPKSDFKHSCSPKRLERHGPKLEQNIERPCWAFRMNSGCRGVLPILTKERPKRAQMGQKFTLRALGSGWVGTGLNKVWMFYGTSRFWFSDQFGVWGCPQYWSRGAKKGQKWPENDQKLSFRVLLGKNWGTFAFPIDPKTTTWTSHKSFQLCSMTFQPFQSLKFRPPEAIFGPFWPFLRTPGHS